MRLKYITMKRIITVGETSNLRITAIGTIPLQAHWGVVVA